MSYRNLEIWKLAAELTPDIHRMTLAKLPKVELYEEGSQIRRSMLGRKLNLFLKSVESGHRAGSTWALSSIEHPASRISPPASGLQQ